MSLVTATAEQRAALRAAVVKLAHATQPFAESGRAPSTAEAAKAAAAATEAAAALAAVGIS